MWVISRFPGLQIKIRGEEIGYAPNGNVVTRKPKLKVEFRPGYFPEWAHEQAKAKWPSPPGAPDSMMVPKNLYGGCETRSLAIENNWDEEDLAFVEDRMLNWRPRAGTDWFVAEPAKLPAPWRGYKLATAARTAANGGAVIPVAEVIADMVIRTGSDPAEVLAFERQEFGDERPDVLDALERLIHRQQAGDEEEELVVA